MKDPLDIQRKVAPEIMSKLLNSEETMEDRMWAVSYLMYIMGGVMHEVLDDSGYDNSTYFEDTLKILRSNWIESGPPKPGLLKLVKDWED